MGYCTCEDVMNMTKVNSKKLGYDEAEFQELINDWISQAEGFVESYCRKSWKDYYDNEGNLVEVTVPPVIKNVTIRLTSNIIAFHYKRRDDPIRKVNENSVKVLKVMFSQMI